jgi:hypothetical protein
VKEENRSTYKEKMKMRAIRGGKKRITEEMKEKA